MRPATYTRHLRLQKRIDDLASKVGAQFFAGHLEFTVKYNGMHDFQTLEEVCAFMVGANASKGKK